MSTVELHNEGRWMQLSAVEVNRGNEITLLLRRLSATGQGISGKNTRQNMCWLSQGNVRGVFSSDGLAGLWWKQKVEPVFDF
jgi:hypothetical protein